MHHRLIVLVDAFEWKEFPGGSKKREPMVRIKGEDLYPNSFGVRKFLYEHLLDEGFSAQGRYATGVSDWFKIGGRYSGVLTTTQLNPLLWEACLDELEEKANQIGFHGFYRSLTPRMKTKGIKIFKNFFPDFKGRDPVYRDEYRDHGYWDDAQIINKLLWTRWIRDLIKSSYDDPHEDPILYVDGSIKDLKKKDVIDRMWAVVVDYHT